MNNYFLYAAEEQESAAALEKIFQKHKIQCTLVNVPSGFAVIKYLEQIKANEAYPSLIILDLTIPRLNGIETLKLLKTDDLYRLIPVVIFSAGLSPEDEEICKSLGADVLIRPAIPENWPTLIDCVNNNVD